MAHGDWQPYKPGVWVAMDEDGSWWWALSAHGFPEYGPYLGKEKMVEDANAWISWKRRDQGQYRGVR
jgi:hypothetical protein